MEMEQLVSRIVGGFNLDSDAMYTMMGGLACIVSFSRPSFMIIASAS